MNSQEDKIVDTSVHLSLIEVSLGAILHSLHVPFTGHCLSLNQGLVLDANITKNDSRIEASKFAFTTSIVVSILKSLSPAGKKLGPMISISSQGALYSIGILLLGNNKLGRMLGLALLSFWAFAQPFITYFLLFGPDLLLAFNYFVSKLEKHFSVTTENIWSVFIIAVLIKAVLAILIPLFSTKIMSWKFFKTKFTKKDKKKKFKLPLFYISLVLMLLFYIFHGESSGKTFWFLLRPLALYIAFHYLSRSIIIRKYMASMMEKTSFGRKVSRLAAKSFKRIEDKL
jgi:hypothetical protein